MGLRDLFSKQMRVGKLLPAVEAVLRGEHFVSTGVKSDCAELPSIELTRS